jgi:tetratricopeptide (TPR) repeat protein
MSVSELLNYPPREIFDSSLIKNRNFEHIILWMLSNNESCRWADFKENPINLKQATLSKYLRILIDLGYIENFKRGHYRITSKGKERFNLLSQSSQIKRKLSYPPKIILRKRRYDHYILWMLYNNEYCKWSDFRDESSRVYINQSSLSKNLNLLRDKGFIGQEKSNYKITPAGKVEYSRMLKIYDLDRQSILDEESKRIQEITKQLISFFEKFEITSDNIKFRFLNNVLKLPYERVRETLRNEEDFKKILLFLAINHPEEYPNYISPAEFSKTYDIKKTELDYFIEKIVEENIFELKFFKLEVFPDQQYYFQVDEYLEKILRTTVDNYITRYTYLNRIYGNIVSSVNIKEFIKKISKDLCGNILHNELENSLVKFLPNYIKYLAYKLETEKKLLDRTDKFEGIAWQDITALFQNGNGQNRAFQAIPANNMDVYHLDPNIFGILKPYFKLIIPLAYQKVYPLTKKKEYNKALALLNSLENVNQNDILILVFKAMILSLLNRNHDANELLKDQLGILYELKDSQIYASAFFVLVFSYISLGDITNAQNISDKIFEFYPEHPLSFAVKGLILGYNIIYNFKINDVREDEAFDFIDKAILLDPNKSNKSLYYQFKAFILQYMKRSESALEAINDAIKLNPKKDDLYLNKISILKALKQYEDALNLIDNRIREVQYNNKEYYIQKIKILKREGKTEESLEVIDELIETDPENYDLLNHKAYWLGNMGKKEEAIETIENLINIVPNNGNFHDSYGEILMEFEQYEDAIEQYKKAIEIEPHGWFTYQSYIKMGKCYKMLGDYDSALDNIKKGKKLTYSCFCDFQTKKYWDDHADKLITEINELKKK